MGHTLNASTPADGLALYTDPQGVEVHATLLRISRYQAVFEIYNPGLVLRTSEVLGDFKILLSRKPVYAGKAVISNLVNLGSVLLCEAALEDAWLDVDLFAGAERGHLRGAFEEFLRVSQQTFKIQPEFKLKVADMHTFLTNLRLWLEQVELAVRSSPSADRVQMEKAIVRELEARVLACIDGVWAGFEALAGQVEEELQPVHRTYLRRQLHPLILCSPFAYRTFTKPLGYAGDYEVVNMITREPEEGSSLFAKMVNVWLLQQPPAQAHRNRLEYLAQRLLEETARAERAGRRPRIYNLGCGPAVEVQRFLREQALSSQAHLTLVDFNDETLLYARRVLEESCRRQARQAAVQTQKKSVQQILKEAGRGIQLPPEKQYDFIYCAGLFDYLPDAVCRRLTDVFYEWLAPGGLLVVTNVEATKPFRHSMDYLLEWHLICRSGKNLLGLAPSQAPAEECSVKTDLTGVNVFLEVRKGRHG